MNTEHSFWGTVGTFTIGNTTMQETCLPQTCVIWGNCLTVDRGCVHNNPHPTPVRPQFVHEQTLRLETNTTVLKVCARLSANVGSKNLKSRWVCEGNTCVHDIHTHYCSVEQDISDSKLHTVMSNAHEQEDLNGWCLWVMDGLSATELYLLQVWLKTL